MPSVICPTVLAQNEAEYATQMRRISPFAKRIQIDVMDGEFAQPASIALDKLWWPHHVQADLHVMYQRPMEQLDTLINLKPHMVIFHVESMFHHMHLAALLHTEGIKAGLAILPDTPVRNVEQIISSFDHLLLFSGHLGHFGGTADLNLLHKVQEAKEHHPDLEIGWDGGINAHNAHMLAQNGIDVLNVGSAIQKADDPRTSYDELVQIIR